MILFDCKQEYTKGKAYCAGVVQRFSGSRLPYVMVGMEHDRFLAHISADGREQTVAEHLQNVAELSAEKGRCIGVENLAYLQAIIHDFGKLNGDFTEYISGKNSIRRGEIDHSYAGAKYIYELAEKSPSILSKEAARLAARTVISHHGLHDWLDSDGNDYFIERISKTQRYDCIKENIGGIISDGELLSILEKSAGEYEQIIKKIHSVCDSLPKSTGSEKAVYGQFCSGLFERLSESILMDADRSDTADFSSGYKAETDFDTKQLWEDMHDIMQAKCDAFKQKKDLISKRRTDISRRCAEFAKEPVGVCRLIVPTGGGKTLSSLRFAIEYCRNFSMKKIFYIAPYMSILKQNSDEIKGIAGEDNVLEHYSDFGQNIDSEEEYSEYELHAERWDKPVITTTLVQFLNTLFSAKTASVRRMNRLCKSVIIIDEVQSIPVKCVSMFNMAMSFLARVCGCTVVLCSATQPSLDECRYPVLLDKRESMTGDYTEDFGIFKRVEVINCVTAKGFTYDEAAEFCHERYIENGSLLVVLNTRSSAEKVFKHISEIDENSPPEARATLIHLSANMCPQQRIDKINEMKKLLNDGAPVICVTTSLIEAGVDILFKCVVRSLAGLDSVAQASGRCNRNGQYSCCPVYIIWLPQENISMLKQLTSAQAAATEILYKYKSADILGTDIQNKYFKRFYAEESKNLDYPETDLGTGTSLVEMLSHNTVRAKIKRCPNRPYWQSFASAGKLFEVINEASTEIIVPYNAEAKEIICALGNDLSPNERAMLLRRAQKYSVSIYEQTKARLNESGAIYMMGDGQIAVLKEGFYSEKTGVDPDGSDDTNLIM